LKDVFTFDVIPYHRDQAFDTLRDMIINRFDQPETLIERRPKLRPGTMLKPLVEYFVQSNLPISQVDASLFRNCVSCINPGIASDLANSHQPRSAIILQAVAFRNSTSAATWGSWFASVMADGVRKAGRVWLGICFATASQLHFWRLVHGVDQRASTRANTLADTVLDVRVRRLMVCSIMTDNASNKLRLSIPALQHQCRALTHTGSFAVGDFLRVLGTKQATAWDVWTDIVGPCGGLTHWSWTSQFHELPGLCRTRWLSIGDFVVGIGTRYPEIRDVLKAWDDAGRVNILRR
jgi:hypothetical protein